VRAPSVRPPVLRGVALELAECGPQIGDQIVAILDSD
jgi:hypothetical protein